ncbi:hypothetical protein B0J13DRAFT_522471 [Dactylonectria estremocensis]|uniref:C2H2-type domain-containing protein n=1 Tax=Dactylonectria estremocensis TaxID=1079267 RepID=A0A9P9F2W8_9HYPO|nr:hypothetical protein B0J13DRAFT_522471 [Dactylonectria estremocensis]
MSNHLDNSHSPSTSSAANTDKDPLLQSFGALASSTDSPTSSSGRNAGKELEFEERPFPCPRHDEFVVDGLFYCDRPQCQEDGFVTASDRKKHIRTHEKPVICPKCTRTMAAQRDMRKHMETHGKQKQIPCKICKKMFTREYNLNRHEKAQHSGRSEPVP